LQRIENGPHKRRIAVIGSKGSGSQDASMNHASRFHRPATHREASPQPDAVSGRAASSLVGHARSLVAVGIMGRLAGLRWAEAGWASAATLGVIALAFVLYVVNLTVSGYANTYYAAAALAGSQSWSAWFFGSLDPANFITIDKPPLSTMLLGLSVRVFGLSSWSILLPQALAGVATVAILMATVRRTFGRMEAVIAGLVAALTPAAILMFRYDNPDALLTLLLVGSAYAFVRALEAGRFRWVVLAAALIGLGFLTKYLQAYLVLPVFAFTWAIAAPGSIRRRIGGLLVALAMVIVSSGWWVAVVELIPAAARPYIGGSETNSVLDLLLGYDGLGRIFGQGGGGGAAGPGGGGFSGDPGILRLFNAEFGGQVSWLLPLAIGATLVGLWLRRRAPRTDLRRAGYLLWSGWLAVHVLVFSFMSGIIHTYYAVVMAPALGALVGAGMVELWRLRSRSVWGGILLGGAILGSAGWAWALLERTPDFAPGLGVAILAAGGLAAVAVAIPARPRWRRAAALGAGLGLAVLLAGPAAFAVDTMRTAYSGGDPSAGPTATGASSGPGRFAGGAPAGGGPAAGALPVPPDGTADGAANGVEDGTTDGARPDDRLAAGDDGGFGGGVQVDDALASYLAANQGSATWIVAVNGANQAGSIELATGLPVMAMGGFSGNDPAPTLEQLQAYVESGQLRYVLIGNGGGGGGPNAGSSDISAWVTANGALVEEVGNGALYDLSAPAQAS
jgi:4-amino-4-deoxy-L-arabinose transferase-like glycosyltransferase